jgi:hypothetical protein
MFSEISLPSTNFQFSKSQREMYAYLFLVVRVTIFTIRSRSNFITKEKDWRRGA